MLCPLCQSEINDNANYCRQCGKRIPRCPTCGNVVQKKNRFCVHDGELIPEEVLLLFPEAETTENEAAVVPDEEIEVVLTPIKENLAIRRFCVRCGNPCAAEQKVCDNCKTKANYSLTSSISNKKYVPRNVSIIVVIALVVACVAGGFVWSTLPHDSDYSPSSQTQVHNGSEENEIQASTVIIGEEMVAESTGSVTEAPTVEPTEGTTEDPIEEPTVPIFIGDPVAVTLKVWGQQEDQVDQNSWLIQMEKAFEVAHPEYDIFWDNGVCHEGDAMSLVTSNPDLAADVYMFSNDQLETMVRAGVLAKLDGIYLEQVHNDVSTTYINTVTYSDGGVYGFPIAPNTWFMYYNKSILSEEDVKSLEACLVKGKVAFEITNSWYLPSFFFAAGGTLFGETGNQGAEGAQFGGSIGINATNAILNLLDNPNFIIDGEGLGIEGLKNGTVVACFSGSWDYHGLQAVLGDDLGAAVPPTVMINGQAKQLKAYAGSKVIGVNPNSDNLRVAMEFAAFLASSESQLVRFQLRNITPSITALAEKPRIAASVIAAAEIATMEYASVAQPSIVEMNRIWGPIGDYGQKIASGQINSNNVQSMVELLYEELN